LGLEGLNLKFNPLYPQKNVKIGTLSWRSMENCSRPNSGTVSRIQFKLGTRIAPKWHHVTWLKGQKDQRSRSQRIVMYPITIVITQYWVVVSSSYLKANMRKTPNEWSTKWLSWQRRLP